MDIKKTIYDYLLENIIKDVTKIEDDQQLIDSGLIDSISIVNVILFMESQFKIAFTEDDLTPENFETLNSMVHIVELKSVCQKNK